MTDEIREEIRLRDYYHKKYREKKLTIFWDLFRNFRNHVSNMLKKSKSDYYHSVILENKHKPRTLWKHLRELLPGSKGAGINGIFDGNKIVKDKKDMANIMNEHFTTIGHKLVEQLPSPQNPPDLTNIMPKVGTNLQLCNISPDYVEKQLKNLPTRKAVGLDKLPNKLLKEAAAQISHPLTFIFNMSLQTGTFPSEWKKARVIPVFKSGDRTTKTNYRPISVLPVVSKILERYVHTTFMAFLTKHNLLHLYQSAFRKFHSTTTALLHITNHWLDNIDKGMVTCSIFLDLSKAFDTVNLTILVGKLAQYGVSGKELEWFKSYLFGRKQVVSIDGNHSEMRDVTIGVPQGSILGPLLFLVYMNDLPNTPTKCSVNMFADDTQIDHAAKSPSNLQNTINADLQRVNQFLIENRLSLNVKKTNYMLIGTKERLKKFSNLQIAIGDNKIDRVDSAKYLGVEVDENLNWITHAEKTASKIASKIGILRRLKHIIPNSTLVTVYNSFILPHFDYCDIVWDNTTKTAKENLQKLQNKAARILLGAQKTEHREDLFKTLDWLSLQNRRNLHKCIIVYKSTNSLAPQYLCNLFKTNNEIHKYNTRSKQDLHHVRSTLECHNKGFKASSIRLWNTLPLNIRNQENVNTFKSHAISHFKAQSQF